MGISIDQYRAAVGIFNCRKSCSLQVHKINIPKPLARIVYVVTALLTDGLYLSVRFMLIILSLIVKCGDIELNPGPESYSSNTESYSSQTESISCSYLCKFVHLNVRSLIPNIDQISLEFNDYDIIALTETFLDDSIDDNDTYMPGFCLPFRRDRNRHGGGVCIYVKSTLFAERCPDLENPDIECIWLKVRTLNKIFYFGCVYRPPNSENIFWEHLTNSIEKLKDKN